MSEMLSPPLPPDHSDELIAFYRLAMQDVALRLDGAHDLTRKKARALLREIDRILHDLDANASAWISANIPQMYAHGQATALVTLGEVETVRKALGIVATIGIVNEERVRHIVQDAHDDLLAATKNVSRQTKRLVREIVVQQTRRAALTTENTRSVSRRVANQLKSANIAIMDSKGKRWKVEDYARVVVTTKLSEAHREGAIEKAVAEGFDLARISAHGATDACRNFEGAIVSLTGKTPGYRTLAELRGSNLIFHPNCKHSVHPMNPRLLPASVREEAERKSAQMDEALRLAAVGRMNSHGLKKGA